MRPRPSISWASARLEQPRHQHRRLVLHDARAVGEGAPAGGGAGRALGHEPLGGERRRPGGHVVFGGQSRRQCFARETEGVDAEGERRPLVHRPHERLGLRRAVARDPARREPGGERAPRGERVDRIPRRRRLSLARAAPRESAQHRVGVLRRASRAAAREADRVVDGGEGGDALEEDELIGGHVEPPARVRRQDPVEITLPAQRAVDELGGQADVAYRHVAPRRLRLQGQIGERRVGLHALEDARRQLPRGRGRGATTPVARRGAHAAPGPSRASAASRAPCR